MKNLVVLLPLLIKGMLGNPLPKGMYPSERVECCMVNTQLYRISPWSERLHFSYGNIPRGQVSPRTRTCAFHSSNRALGEWRLSFNVPLSPCLLLQFSLYPFFTKQAPRALILFFLFIRSPNIVPCIPWKHILFPPPSFISGLSILLNNNGDKSVNQESLLWVPVLWEEVEIHRYFMPNLSFACQLLISFIFYEY